MSIPPEITEATLAVPQPTETPGRILSLDVLRGIGVLGILVMNIQTFSMPDAAYFNPSAYGDLTGLNFGVWLVSHLFAELKFMTVFTVLFGAGIAVFCTRIERRGFNPVQPHYRRMLWLMVFGIAHGVLLWTGDILFWYSLSGMLAFLFWRLKPGWLMTWSVISLTCGTLIYLLAQVSMPFWPPEIIEQNSAYWSPQAEEVQRVLDAYRGGWLDPVPLRLSTLLMMQVFGYPFFGIWRTLGLMLAGIALYKWDVLSAQRSNRFYLATFSVGVLIGFPTIAFGAIQHIAHGWSFAHSMFGGSLFNYWGSLFMAAAYISLVMLICRNGWLRDFQKRIAPVGRMAFTSYILQTVICTTVFYGYGFGLYGRVPRWGQMLMVFGVWLVLIVLANVWLSRFQFGPLEWLWRSLTYRKRQPMLLHPKSGPVKSANH